MAAAATGRRRRQLDAGLVVVVGLAVAGAAMVVVDNSMKGYFGPGLALQRDDRLLNERSGGTNRLYVVLDGQRDDAMKDPRRLREVQGTQRFLEAQPHVGKTLSVVDFVTRMNQAVHGDDPAHARVPESRELVSQLLLLHSMSGEPGDLDAYVDYPYRAANVWVFLRTEATAEIRALIDRLTAHLAGRFGEEVQVGIGGSVPMAVALTEATVRGKILNIAQIATAIFLLSAAVFRSLAAGLLVLAPLALAVLATFGLMGAGGIPLNIPTSVVAAMAVGIGADYAIYLIARLREELSGTADEAAAVTTAPLTTAGTAIVFVATAVAGGYGVLLLSWDFRLHTWLGLLIALWLKAQPRLGPGASVVLEGWVRNEELFRAERTDGILREGYVWLSHGPVDLRIGRQIIAWGRADRINPTDNLTPRDFTLLVPDDDDQRRGTASVRGSVHRGGFSFTAVWLPEFIPDTVPIRPLGAGAELRERLPAQPAGQWAVKLEHTGSAVEWSLSYFDGFDLRPDLGVDRIDASGLYLLMRHHPIRVVGADAAATVGRFALCGEVAYTRTENVEGDDPSVKNPFVFLVLGVERTFRESLTVNLQYLLRYTIDYRSPFEIADPVTRRVAIEAATISRELDRVQHGASLRVSRKWLHDTLETEVAAVVGFARLDYAIRPKVTYAFTDRLRGTVGGDVFGGDRHSLFGYLRPAAGAYAELRWDF